MQRGGNSSPLTPGERLLQGLPADDASPKPGRVRQRSLRIRHTFGCQGIKVYAAAPPVPGFGMQRQTASPSSSVLVSARAADLAAVLYEWS
jgi:hypothetical protein